MGKMEEKLLIGNYSYIQDELICGNITNEEAKTLVEKTMTLAGIEKKYGKMIKQLPNNGRWWIRLDGKAIYKTTRQAVLEEIAKRQNQKDNLNFELINVAERWLNIRQHEVSDGTWSKDYNFIHNFIVGSNIEHKKIDKIIYSDAIEWCNYCLEKKKDMKEKYFNNLRCQMNKLFEFATKEQLIVSNPFTNLSIHRDKFSPKIEHKDHDLIFSDFEKQAVKEKAYEEAEKGDTVALGLAFLFCTGLRDGELCELRWKDIENNNIHVQRELVSTVDKERGKINGYKTVFHTKTQNGDRYIPLNAEAQKILKKQKDICISKSFSVENEDFIFRRKKKDEVLQCNTRCFEPKLKRYCREIGMQELKSQHDIRRTFCTNLYYSGMPLKNIQKIMGHGSLKQTMDYIKFNDEIDTLQYLEVI